MGFEMMAISKERTADNRSAANRVDLNWSVCCRWILNNCPDVPETEDYFEFDGYQGSVSYQSGIDAASILSLRERVKGGEVVCPEDMAPRHWEMIRRFLDQCHDIGVGHVFCSY